MKRAISLLLALSLICCALPALAAGGEISYDRVVETALIVREMSFGDYMTFKGVPERMQNRARNWALGIDDTPDLVVRLDIGECPYVREYRAIFMSEHPMVSAEAQSDAMAIILNSAMLQATTESLTGPTVQEVSEVNAAVNAGAIFADTEAEDGCALYIVLYENAQPLMILTSVENGAVMVHSRFVPSPRLAAASSYAEVALWFMRLGCPMTGAQVFPQ